MVTTSGTVDFENVVTADELAADISLLWRDWGQNFRNGWLEEKKELRNYLFATDTSTTSNKVLPWSNSTTTPKLTQIRDNLHANYMAALFPNSNWLDWRANDFDEENERKAAVIKGYMLNKTRQSEFDVTVAKIIADYIDYGNCFGKTEFVSDYTDVDGELIPRYIGPKLVRVSPYDIGFNPTAPSFKESPKIWKKIVGLGDIKQAVEMQPEESHLAGVFDAMITARNIIRTSDAEIHKSEGFVADGFDNITHYYDSDYVELLEFYGSIYDKARDVYWHNRHIVVADRAHILLNEAIPSWLGHDGFHHAGWRDRPDNLYAMGPLDNLVGLQYRIDHLENLKADVFDMIAWPVQKIRGDVDDYDYQPGEKIYVGDEGDVEYLVPDATALNADLQIDRLVTYMEQMAGAPQSSMGIRTPGEKTAFEVDTLSNAADRIFKHRTNHFERVFLEPALSDMLEQARRNLNTADTIRVLDDETGNEFFQQITREDLKANGKLIPIGARHFAERNTRVQNLTQLVNLKLSDPSIGVHLSGKRIAERLAEELNDPELFEANISVTEQLESSKVAEEAAVQFEEDQIVAAEQGL